MCKKYTHCSWPTRAKPLHVKGVDFAIRLITGASVGDQVDNELVTAMCDKWCELYQSSCPSMRGLVKMGA